MISWHKMVEVPITQEVIDNVELTAKKEGMKPSKVPSFAHRIKGKTQDALTTGVDDDDVEPDNEDHDHEPEEDEVCV